MFDLFAVSRNRRLASQSYDRMVDAMSSRASDRDIERARDNYIADLMAEAEAAGLRVIVHNVDNAAREAVEAVR